MSVRIQVRRDDSANWIANNPSLREGEMGIELDTLKIKIGPTPVSGDSTPWNSITAYANIVPSDFDTIINGYLEFTDIGAQGGVVGLNSSKNAIIPGSSIILEGATDNAYETTLTVTDPTADRTITFKNADGTVAFVADIPTTTDALTEGSTNKYFSDERAQDAVANALAAGSHTNITVTYNDAANSLSIAAAPGYTDEQAQDAVAAALAAGTHTNISVSYNDAGNAISLTGAQTYNDENAQDAIGNNLGTGLSYNDATGAISVDSTIATKAYTDTAISNLVASSPATLDTLNELAAALGNDASFSTTITNSIATKAPIASPTFTGTVSGITKTMVGLANVDNTTDASKPISTATQTALDLKAPISTAVTLTGTQTLSNKTLSSPTITAPGSVGTTYFTNRSLYVSNGITSSGNKWLLNLETYGISQTGAQVILTGNWSSANNAAVWTVETSGAYYDSLTLDYTPYVVLSAPKATYPSLSLAAGSTVTLTAASPAVDINISATEISYLDGVTSAIQTQLDSKAPLVSPALTGVPTAPTAAAATNTTQVATTAFVRGEVTALVNGASAALDTLGELAAALTADEATAATLATLVGTKAPIASPTFTGTVSGITKSMVGLGNVDNTSDTSKPISTATQTALDFKAPLASPTFTGTVSGITKTMVGLGNVDNTTDSLKPISTATQTALDAKLASATAATTYETITNVALKAPLASPALTGSPTAPTALAADNSTKIATTEYADRAASNATAALVASAPATLDTLNELAAALGNDASFSTTITNSIATKAPIASPTFTGTVSGITKTMVGLGNVDNTTDALKPISTATQTALDLKAPLASPTFTGTVVLPSTVNGPGIGTSVNLLSTTTSGDITLGLAQTTGNVTIGGGSARTTGSVLIGTGATSTGTKTINIGTGSTGGTTAITIGSSSGATSTIALNGTVTPTTLTPTNALGAIYGGTGLTSYTSGDILYASATNTLSKLAKGTDGQILTLASGVPSWAAAPAGFSAPTIGSTSISSGATVTSIAGLTLNATSTTTVSANTATTIDTNALSGFTTLKYVVSIKQGSKVRSSEIIAQTDGTSVDYTEFGITETGGTMSGILTSVSVSSTNAVLQVTITDAASTNATVKIQKVLI